MKLQKQPLSAASIISLPSASRQYFLDNLDESDAKRMFEGWEYWAHPAQRPPEGDWRIWLLLGGRGCGKTRAGAEWIAHGIRARSMRRVALIAATHADARSVMIEGASGMLSVSESASYEPSNRRILWPGGAVATVMSAEEPDSIRGHQFDAAWCDEFCKWEDPQGALDMALMGLRLGEDPRMAITTTPRNIAALRDLIASSEVALTQSKTDDNKAYLAPGFLKAMQARYAGTRLGRQELDGDLIEDNEAALWRRDWIENARVKAAPPLQRIVVAVDPPVSVKGDECGIVVAGRTESGKAYVLADRSKGGLTTRRWAERVADAYEEFACDCVVAEANQGGDMVKSVLLQAAANLPLKLVHATRSKQVRAEPAALRYEQGRVHHAGVFAELEDQMCQYDGTGKSPDRMDALVWALAELFPQTRAAEPRVRVL
jgi:phage terminase large subunit-like protein